MEYRALNGPIYCRPALTPPIINSPLATEIGIRGVSRIDLEAGGNVPLSPGSNVKLRMVLDNGLKRMTCHAKIDGWHRDRASGKLTVDFSNLSLSDWEFELLRNSFLEEPLHEVAFTGTLRGHGREAPALGLSEGGHEITRIKAVTMPLALIDRIDDVRGDTPFSDFVVDALRSRLMEESAGKSGTGNPGR